MNRFKQLRKAMRKYMQKFYPLQKKVRMIFVIDETGTPVFKQKIAEDEKLKIALVAGVAFPKHAAKTILSYLNLYHKNNSLLEKGRDIQDEAKIIKFIEALKKIGAYGAFFPGDHGLITWTDAEQYRDKVLEGYKQYARSDHQEYSSLTPEEREKLVLKISRTLDQAKMLSNEEFYRMLMIMEVIFELLYQLFNIVAIIDLNDIDLDGIEIVIHTQTDNVKRLIDDGFLYYFLFRASRDRPLNNNKRTKEFFKKFFNINNNKTYLNVSKLIIKTAIVSDAVEPLVFVADYIANFTRRALRGDLGPLVVDKLAELYVGRSPIYHFSTTKDYIYQKLPDKSQYAFRVMIKN